MKIKTVCNCCNREIEKDHWNVIENKPLYCSRRCSNIKSNSRWDNYISKNERGVCEKCGNRRDVRNKSKLCQLCLNVERKTKVLEMTIGELKEKHKLKIGKWYSAEIRNHCRNHNVELTKLPCQKCGYDKHVELCHIKPVNTFGDDITIREVNNPSNIIVLCPNHHWEFDNGVLTLQEIGGRSGS